MSDTPDVALQPIRDAERNWVRRFTTEHWGADFVVSRGKIHYPHELSGFVARSGDEAVGLLTYVIEDGDCEVVTLQSLRQFAGIGTALMQAVIDIARQNGCRRVWLITTNDNLDALRFYQRRGFALKAVYPNAMEETRRLKPAIPPLGDYDIPLRDEIELEYVL